MSSYTLAAGAWRSTRGSTQDAGRRDAQGVQIRDLILCGATPRVYQLGRSNTPGGVRFGVMGLT
eukprot:5157456-Prymnesium_polylepis.1